MNRLTHLIGKRRSSLLWVALGLLWVACEKTPPTKPAEIFTDSLASGLLIASEGNFQWNNASFSFIEAKTGKLHENIYATVNQKNLGDVL